MHSSFNKLAGACIAVPQWLHMKVMACALFAWGWAMGGVVNGPLSQALARVTGPEAGGSGLTLILTLSVFCSLGSGDLVAHG